MPIIELEGRHIHSQVYVRVQKKAYNFFGTLKRKESGFFLGPTWKLLSTELPNSSILILPHYVHTAHWHCYEWIESSYNSCLKGLEYNSCHHFAVKVDANFQALT